MIHLDTSTKHSTRCLSGCKIGWACGLCGLLPSSPSSSQEELLLPSSSTLSISDWARTLWANDAFCILMLYTFLSPLSPSPPPPLFPPGACATSAGYLFFYLLNILIDFMYQGGRGREGDTLLSFSLSGGECGRRGCSGHGSCIDGECKCLPGFFGDSCETDASQIYPDVWEGINLTMVVLFGFIVLFSLSQLCILMIFIRGAGHFRLFFVLFIMNIFILWIFSIYYRPKKEGRKDISFKSRILM